MTKDDLDGGMFGMTGMTRKTRMARMTGITRITRVNKMTGVNGITGMSIACEHSCLSSLLAARDISQERCLLLNERNSTLMMQINVYIM